MSRKKSTALGIESLEGRCLLSGTTFSAAASGQADLIFTQFTARIAAGKVVINNTFKNQGTAATAGAFATRFFLSADAVLDDGDIPLGNRSTISRVKIGGARSAINRFNVPAGVNPGDYYVLGKVDADNTQSEVNETNNERSVGPRGIRSDLLSRSLAAVWSEQTVHVTDIVRNQNLLPTNGSFRIDYYLSTDVQITTSDILLGSRTVSKSLKYGAQDRATSIFNLPAGFAGGTWRIGAIVDGGDDLAESLETNNTRASPPLVLPSIPPSPPAPGADLTLTRLVPSIAGSNIAIADSVGNLGAENSSAFVVSYYLSTDASVTSSDTLLGSRTIAALAAGGTDSSISTFAIPSLPIGDYFLGARVDSDDAVAESNEQNNVLASNASFPFLRLNGEGSFSYFKLGDNGIGASLLDLPSEVVGIRFMLHVNRSESTNMKIAFMFNDFYSPGQTSNTAAVNTDLFSTRLVYANDPADPAWPPKGVYVNEPSLRIRPTDYNADGLIGLTSGNPTLYPRQTFGIDDITSINAIDAISQESVLGQDLLVTLERLAAPVHLDQPIGGLGLRYVNNVMSDLLPAGDYWIWHVTVQGGSSPVEFMAYLGLDRAQYLRDHVFLSEFFPQDGTFQAFTWDTEVRRDGSSTWLGLDRWAFNYKSNDNPNVANVNYGPRLATYDGHQVIELSTGVDGGPYATFNDILTLG